MTRIGPADGPPQPPRLEPGAVADAWPPDAFTLEARQSHEWWSKLIDETIQEMIDIKKPVIVDVAVDKAENCFPMIPSGKAHNEMILAELADDAGIELGAVIDEKGKMLV